VINEMAAKLREMKDAGDHIGFELEILLKQKTAFEMGNLIIDAKFHLLHFLVERAREAFACKEYDRAFAATNLVTFMVQFGRDLGLPTGMVLTATVQGYELDDYPKADTDALLAEAAELGIGDVLGVRNIRALL